MKNIEILEVQGKKSRNGYKHPETTDSYNHSSIKKKKDNNLSVKDEKGKKFSVKDELKKLLTDRRNFRDNVPKICQYLRKFKAFRSIKASSSNDLFYKYDYKLKYYRQSSKNVIVSLINRGIKSFGVHLHHKLVKDIMLQLEMEEAVEAKDLIQRFEYLNFMNGILDIKNGKFIKHTPKLFVTSKLRFNYSLKVNQKKLKPWLTYLKHFMSNNEEHIKFLRSWMKLLIHNETSTQTLLYVYGPAQTGKSVFSNVCSILVGQDATVNSSIRALNGDRFEAYNLLNKKLVLLADTEHYKGDQSKLKMITGNDKIPSRKKNVQGAFDFYPRCLVLITSNFKIGSADSSGGLSRRVRIVEANNRVEKKEVLLELSDHGMRGSLVKSLSAIFNWVNSLDLKDAIDTVSNFNPGEHLMGGINSVQDWVHDQVEAGPGAYLGYKVSMSKEDKFRVGKGGFLYPYYQYYCQRRDLMPVSHKNISEDIVSAVSWPCEIIRKREGMYIKGLKIKEEVLEQGIDYLGPIDPKVSEIVEKAEEKEAYSLAEFKKVDNKDMLETDLYKGYMNLLSEQSPIKKRLNKLIRKNLPDIDELIKTYLKPISNPTNKFKQNVIDVFTKNKETVKKYGLIPTSYKQMGTSPRILPERYGNTLNSTKKLFREACYKVIPTLMDSFCVVDFDLVSCYNSIILGLYPDELVDIKLAIEGKGLWNHLKDEFERKGSGSYWDKKAVKICVYSSFFLGGPKAMMSGIIDSQRKELGFTDKQFKDYKEYEVVYKRASDMAQFMMESSVINNYRTVANLIQSVYKDKYLVGPTGHHYFVSDPESFKNAYPNFLQSYEFAIMSKASRKVKEKFKGVEFIGHYHDGNTLLIPIEIKEEVIKYYLEQATEIGKSLKLRYPIRLEVQATFENETL